MQEVLAISCSARKEGNTTHALEILIKKLKENGFSTKLISLADLKINPCLACNKCSETGKCVQEDDAAKVFFEMRNSEFIVIGSPVYRGGVPAQLKCLMDRSNILFNDKNELLEDKVGSIIVTGKPEGQGKLFSADEIMNFFVSLGILILPPLAFWTSEADDGKVEYLADRIVALGAVLRKVGWLA